MYTDDTLLTFGKYKFTALCRVPAEYLLLLYNENFPNKDLRNYIERNLERIKRGFEKKIVAPELVSVCDKITYASEKTAKLHLKSIAKREQEHKKPVRAYECEKCSGWHLTSIAHEAREVRVR